MVIKPLSRVRLDIKERNKLCMKIFFYFCAVCVFVNKIGEISSSKSVRRVYVSFTASINNLTAKIFKSKLRFMHKRMQYINSKDVSNTEQNELC